MHYYLNAQFEVALKEGVTTEQVRAALCPLLELTGERLRAQPRGLDVDVWFFPAGARAGCTISGRFPTEFPGVFFAAARAMSELSSDAFEASLTDDDAPSEEDRVRSHVFGPPQAVREAIHDRRLFAAAAALEFGVGQLEALDCAGEFGPSCSGVSLVNNMFEDAAIPVLSLNLDELRRLGVPESVANRAAEVVAGLANVIASSIDPMLGDSAPASRYMALLPRTTLLPHDTLSAYEVASLHLPADEQWEQVDGPSCGVGEEMWFQGKGDRTRLLYVVVEDGQVTTCQEHEQSPDENERPRELATERG